MVVFDSVHSYPVYTIQPVGKRLDNRLHHVKNIQPVVKPFGLYRVYNHSTGCQTGLTTDLTTGCIV